MVLQTIWEMDSVDLPFPGTIGGQVMHGGVPTGSSSQEAIIQGGILYIMSIWETNMGNHK